MGVNLANCKKITSTLFPFPYAQMIGLLLIQFSLLTPVIISGILEGRKAWGFVFSLVPIFGLYALNFIAKELEMPFGDDPNDLPLLEFHEHMNGSLLMLIREETDLVPHIDGETCNMNYDGIREHTSRRRPKDYVIEGESACIIQSREYCFTTLPSMIRQQSLMRVLRAVRGLHCIPSGMALPV